MPDDANKEAGQPDQSDKPMSADERWSKLSDAEKALIRSTLTRHKATLEELAKR